MIMFKIGDKVKVIKRIGFGTQCSIGDEGTVCKSHIDTSLVCVDLGERLPICGYPDKFELVEKDNE